MYTIARRRPNPVRQVTEDVVIIEGRVSRLPREQIVAAYNRLTTYGEFRTNDRRSPEPGYVWSAVPAILVAALPDQIEIIPHGRPSGIRLKQ